MTPDQIHLLRKSFSQIESQSQIAALSFYRRLFELAPGLRPLFKSGIEEQSRKFIEMLTLAVSLTDRPGALETELRELGARHLDYGTSEEHYSLVGRALLGMLADMLGTDFTPATRAAWTEFYTGMADAMKKGATASLTSSTAHPQPVPVERGHQA